MHMQELATYRYVCSRYQWCITTYIHVKRYLLLTPLSFLAIHFNKEGKGATFEL
jgi:hypothetical protein